MSHYVRHVMPRRTGWWSEMDSNPRFRWIQHENGQLVLLCFLSPGKTNGGQRRSTVVEKDWRLGAKSATCVSASGEQAGSHEAQGTEAEPEGLAKQLASLGGPEGKSLKQRERQSKLLELNGNDGEGPLHQQVPAR
jgi:hypothetical protein